VNFDPPEKFGVSHMINIQGRNPFGKGVFIGGGLGFRWDPSIKMQN
jgi:taurine dioxygenase